MNLLAALYLVGAVQALILGLALSTLRNENRQANLYLGIFLALFALDLLDYFLMQSGLYTSQPQLLFLVSPLTLAYGPLLYFYIKRLIGDQTVQAKQWRHFILVPLGYGCALPMYFIPLEARSAFIEDPQQILNALAHTVFPLEISALLSGLLSLSITIVPLIYGVVILKYLKRYRQRIRIAFADTATANLSWITQLIYLCLALSILYGISIIWSFGQASIMEIEGTQVAITTTLPITIPVLMSVMALYLAIRALRQPAILHTLLLSTPAAAPGPDARKYARSAVSPSQAQTMQQRLLEFLANSRIYNKSGLTLPELAQHLEVSSHQLSQVINEAMGTSFFDLINRLRIDEAKRLLADESERNSPILAIALQVGYKSKSAFYRLFKERTGLTPTAYRQEQLDQPPR